MPEREKFTGSHRKPCGLPWQNILYSIILGWYSDTIIEKLLKIRAFDCYRQRIFLILSVWRIRNPEITEFHKAGFFIPRFGKGKIHNCYNFHTPHCLPHPRGVNITVKQSGKKYNESNTEGNGWKIMIPQGYYGWRRKPYIQKTVPYDIEYYQYGGNDSAYKVNGLALEGGKVYNTHPQ